MKVFYLWLEWKGLNHAILVFRSTRKDAQAWFDDKKFSSSQDKYNLLECQDDPAVKTDLPETEYIEKLSLAHYDSTSKASYIQIKNDDGTNTRLTQLQKAFEVAFKLEQPLPDSRDADGNSWRDRPKLF